MTSTPENEFLIRHLPQRLSDWLFPNSGQPHDEEAGTSGDAHTSHNPPGGGEKDRVRATETDRLVDKIKEDKEKEEADKEKEKPDEREKEAADKDKDDLIKYMSNGNKTKLMTSGLLNTAALSTNASLLALILKLEKINATASISLCLIILSVTLQLMVAVFTLLEYRATLAIDRDPEKLRRRRTLKKSGNGTNGADKKSPIGSGKTNGDATNNASRNETETTESYSFCKPMELQCLAALCTVFLTVVNTFTIALTSNIRDHLEIPESYKLVGTLSYQNYV